MRFFSILVAVALFAASAVWFAIKPGFDSGTAALTAFGALIGFSFKESKSRGNMVQKIKGNSTGIQAGGDVNIGMNRKD